MIIVVFYIFRIFHLSLVKKAGDDAHTCHWNIVMFLSDEVLIRSMQINCFVFLAGQ